MRILPKNLGPDMLNGQSLQPSSRGGRLSTPGLLTQQKPSSSVVSELQTIIPFARRPAFQTVFDRSCPL